MLLSLEMITYRVKVRGLTYLWGGDMSPATDLTSIYLHFRVEESGETVVISTREKKNDALKLVGTLKPGESFTMPLNNLSGVAAHLPEPADTYVECAVFAGGTA